MRKRAEERKSSKVNVKVEGVRGFVTPVIDRKDGIPDGKMENIPQLIRNEPGAV